MQAAILNHCLLVKIYDRGGLVLANKFNKEVLVAVEAVSLRLLLTMLLLLKLTPFTVSSSEPLVVILEDASLFKNLLIFLVFQFYSNKVSVVFDCANRNCELRRLSFKVLVVQEHRWDYLQSLN
jgi:hypothetical protein